MEAKFPLLAWILLLVCVVCVVSEPPIPPTEKGFFRYGEENRDAKLTKGNDISSSPLTLRWGLPFYNRKYWTIYVNDNGVLSFVNSYSDHSKEQEKFPLGDLPTGQKQILIAPFLANVDTTESGQIFYRQSTEQDLLDRCDDSIRQYFVKFANFKTKFIIIATWEGVSFFGYSGGAAPVNTFQVVLATDEFETFAFFRYQRIQWTAGTESGASENTGDTGVAALMGFNAGDGDRAYEESDHSGNHANLKQLPVSTNSDEKGMFIYHISRANIRDPKCESAIVRTFPRFDSMLGHSWLYAGGPCFDQTRDHWLLFGDVDDPKAITNCTYHSRRMVYCFSPTFFEVGSMKVHLSIDDGLNWDFTGDFDVVKIGDTPQGVTRVNPDSESWLRGDRPVTIEWDPKLINFTQVRIDILAYTEPIDPDTLEPGPPTWEEIDEVSYTVENTGRYTWHSRAVFQVNDRNCMGVIRVTRRYKRDDFALWSDLHFLGYIMNDKFQNDPAVYSNQRCEEFFDREKEAEHDIDLLNNLRPCPCNLTQALADRGRFKPDPMCNMDDAVQDRTQEYCRFRDDVVHCVTNIVPSATGHDSSCCYDEFENLVYAGDSSSGSFSRYVTVEGRKPYREATKVPQLSSAIADYAPYYMCCIWGDHCDYYQEVRPTRDCRWYRPVRAGSVFGDPHFITFDGVTFTFNAKGEYTLVETTSQSQTKFELQGRFEQIVDKDGIPRKASVLTAVGMRQEDLPKVMVRKSDRTVLEVYIDTQLLEPKMQTTIVGEGFYLTFPHNYENGNLTQVIVTWTDSEMAVIVNGTQEMMTAQVLVPYKFRNWVNGLLGSWDDNDKNDLRSRSGASFLPTDDPEVLFRDFGQSWEIESINTLFQYDVRGHDFFQDPNFIPDFNPPTDVGIIDPDNLNRICAGNKLCEYDLQSTGNVELAKATMMAYNQHWLAHGASADLVTCKYLKTPKNGTKTFLRKRNHQIGAEVEFTCEDSFILVGSPYRVCEPHRGADVENPQGQWSGNSDDNECIESQICGGLPTPKHASIEVIGPPENMKVVYTCNENYDLYGRSERFCDAEKENWIYLEPYCYHKLNPAEVAGAVVGGICGFIVLVLVIGICVILQLKSRARRKHEVKQPKKQKKQTKDIAGLGGREPAYQVRDTPVEVQRSYPRTAAEPSGIEYQQRPQYGGQQSYRGDDPRGDLHGSRGHIQPSPHSSQTLQYQERDPMARRPPPEMISPTEPRYAYADQGDDIELELKHGKSLESWA